MISLTDLLMTINTLFIVGLCVHYFKSNYKILDMETYNQVCDICEEYTAMVQEKEDLGECEGFFRDCLVEEDDEEIDPEEEEEEEDSVHSEPIKPEPSKKKRGRKAKKESRKVTSDRKVGF